MRSGIGRAIAQRLAGAGAQVEVADVDVTGTCELIGASAWFVRVDLHDDSAMTELMACQPQILDNNAGGGACWIALRSRASSTDRSAWKSL